MKRKKRFLALLLVFVLVFSAIPAQAAETNAEDYSDMVPEGKTVFKEIEFDIDADNTILLPDNRSVIFWDALWFFADDYQENNMTFPVDNFGFAVKITDFAGNAIGDQVRIELNDTETLDTQYYAVYADGTWYSHNNISVVLNRYYYFYFQDLTSSNTFLKIHMTMFY